jgi:peptidoglycan/LPS O-acetylase OafA/YrhL
VTLVQADRIRPTEELQGRPLAQSGYRPDIEGLRAVAVLAVVLFHADIPGVGGGFVGVDVFFVISGFLITGLLWREMSTAGTVRLRRFYGARARRLLPASATVGVVTMVGAVVLLPVLRARGIVGDGIASALYVSNYRFILEGVNYLGAVAPPSPFQHYWSLGVEEQFYLVWPALIIGTAWLLRHARRRSKAAAPFSRRPYLVVLSLVAAVSFAMSLILTRVLPPVAFFSLPTRAWQLALGGLVSLTAGQWRRLPPLPAAIAGWGGLALILLACSQFGPTTPYPGAAALVPTLGTALLIGAGCATPSRGCGRFLAARPMRAIGRVSYSWYLWHWPVLLVALWSLAPVMGHALWLALAAILISLGLAVLTLRFIENPLRFAASLRRSADRSLVLGAAVTALAVGVGVVLHAPNPVGRGAPAMALTVTAAPPPAGSGTAEYDAAVEQAIAQVHAAVAASIELKAVPSNLDPPLADAEPKGPIFGSDRCFLGFFQYRQTDCVMGDTASPTTAALVGDSNAGMWKPAFQQIAAQRHWRLEMASKADCPFLDLPIINPVLRREYTECQQWRGQVLTRLQNEHPRLVVLSMMRQYGTTYGWRGITSYDPAWIDSLTRLVRQLRGTGAAVLVLGPIPDPHTSTPDCLSVHLDNAMACSPSRSNAVNQPGIAAETAATQVGGGQYADLTELFCATDRCPVIVGNTLVYRDQNHMTFEYSRQLAPVIGALADRVLAHR